MLSRNYVAKTVRNLSNQCIIKDTSMTFLCCLKKPKQVLRFVNYMSKRHKNIKFLFETEKDNSFSFLDVKICREKDKFTTSAFRKDTFSGVYTNFSSFVALKHKFGLVYTLLHRSFTIVSDFSKFHFEVETLKKTLHKNAYPTKFVDKCIAKFVNNIFGQKTCFYHRSKIGTENSVDM